MNKVVLLIDDDGDEMHILTEALNLLGMPFKKFWVNSAEKAYEFLENCTPDYVFLDYNMPVTDGLNCLTEIRKKRNLQKATVVLYSTAMRKEIRHKAFHRGATFCLQKQNSVSELAKAMKFIFTPVNTRHPD